MKKTFILILCCLLFPLSLEAKDLTINLKFTPRDKVKVKPRMVSTERIYFEEVDDSRSHPAEIGENRENKGKGVKILTSGEDEAAQFTLSVLKNEFQDKGFKIESSPNEASKIVSTTLLKFWTLEESTYNTEIQLKVEIRERRGETFFKKTYSSAGSNRGRSLSEVNYNECISDALARIADDLFSDMEFLRILAERPRPPKVEAKPVETKSAEEKRLEEIKAEIKRLEELKAEQQRVRDRQEAEKLAEQKRLEEKLARDRQDAERQAEEKRLQEIKDEVKKLEQLKADEKQAMEKREEEKRAEEKRLEDLKNEVKKLEEIKALKEEMLAEEKRAEEKRAEEKRLEAEKRAKEKKTAPVKTKPADPVFGPK